MMNDPLPLKKTVKVAALAPLAVVLLRPPPRAV